MITEILLPSRFVDAANASGFDNENENGAWALYSRVNITRDPWTEKSRQKLILRKLIPLTALDIASSSPVHLTVRTAGFMKVLKEAAQLGLVPGFLHGHPSGQKDFSVTDDANERALLKAAQNRNGKQSELVSLLVLPDGSLRGRHWSGIGTAQPCQIMVTGGQLSLHNHNLSVEIDDKLDRQARIFGHSFNTTLSKLRVLIVGSGGTGSPLSLMLARAGVKKVGIIDPDTVEETNLHRLHGISHDDIGRPKAIVLAEHIRSLGLNVEVNGIQGNILDFENLDLLKSADIVFCATDDHAGRMMLNRYAYFYDTPVIDLGLAVAKNQQGNLQDITGRVSILCPGTPCLMCRKVIDPRLAREEELFRHDPELFRNQRAEGYVIGGGDPEPAFIAMTTSIACMALEEFAQMLSGFRGHDRQVNQRLRRFLIPDDRRSGGNPSPSCPICASNDYWGLGDVTPFLDRVA